MIDRLYEYVQLVRRALTPGSDLSGRTVTGGVWVTLINVSDRALQLLMVVIVARLIGPTEFGLMGIALLTLTALQRLTQLGINAALIQRAEENVDRYLNTAWCLQIGRGLVLAAAAYLIAPLAGTFFDAPRAVPLIRVIALTILVRGLANPGIMYFQKNLEFHKQFAYRMSERLVYVTVAISYAVAYRSVWALAFGYLAGTLAGLVASYLIHEYRPRPVFSVEFARELLDYGKWIFGSDILAFLTNEGDDAFVGWYLSATALGFYQMGYQISNAPATEITHMISEVVFPAYSKLQDNMAALRQGYFNTLQLVAFVTFPAAVGIFVVMPSFVETFLGADWRPMILPAQLLAAYGLFHSLRTAVVPLFRAVGRPDLDTKIRVLKIAFIVAFIVPASDAYGLVGVSLVIVGNSMVANPVAHYLGVRLVNGHFRELVRIFGYPTLGSVLMGASVLLIQEMNPIASSLFEFALSMLIGLVVYGGVMLGVERFFDYDMRRIVRTVQKSLA